MTTYITIGNTDGTLTQQRWSRFHELVDGTIRRAAESVNNFTRPGWQVTIHGAWVSPSTAPWQNACWAIEGAGQLWDDCIRIRLRQELQYLAHLFGQDSIAWADSTPEFLPPLDQLDAPPPFPQD